MSEGKIIDTFFKILEIVAVLVMAGCFVLGIADFVHGFWLEFLGFRHPPYPPSTDLIDSMLDGLELFFLGSLPFLALRSITDYYLSMNGRGKSLADSHRLLVQVKQLMSGLMIATVATELIHRIFKSRQSNTPEALLSPLFLAATLGLIVVLCLYNYTTRENAEEAAAPPPTNAPHP